MKNIGYYLPFLLLGWISCQTNANPPALPPLSWSVSDTVQILGFSAGPGPLVGSGQKAPSGGGIEKWSNREEQRLYLACCTHSQLPHPPGYRLKLYRAWA